MLTGEITEAPDDPPADAVPAFVDKYRDWMTTHFGSPAAFATEFRVPLRFRPQRLRGI